MGTFCIVFVGKFHWEGSVTHWYTPPSFLVTQCYLVMLIEKQRTPLQERQASKVTEMTPASTVYAITPSILVATVTSSSRVAAITPARFVATVAPASKVAEITAAIPAVKEETPLWPGFFSL